jgi:hypothetical protein
MNLLAAGEPHSLVGLEDSTVLVTKVLPPARPAIEPDGLSRDPGRVDPSPIVP